MVDGLCINGRYLFRPPTGVDVVAQEVLARLTGPGIEVLAPEGELFGKPPAQRLVQDGRFSGHFWEQMHLPRMVGGRPLLGFCNTGPVALSEQVVVMHDAQFLDHASSYTWTFRALYRSLLPLVARRARQVISVSHASLRALHEFGVIPKDKGTVILNGSDRLRGLRADDTILERNGLSERGYFLAVGSAAPHKNIGMLCDVFSSFEGTVPPLVIAGGANSAVFSGGFVAASRNIVRLGRVTDGELKSLYSNAVALLFPSLTEGFGLPPLEAMDAGTMAIVSDGGGIPEACAYAALYATPHKADAWYRQILRTIESVALQDEMRAAGRMRSAELTWDRTARAYSELLASTFEKERAA
ncbi:glycosyltransferase family 4 protein [Silicimonas sp. MF1-12-2]|uniref:glycosyltransferase family 4 protein n=1 Tax=Silicimonas sp. MF1-12-2 TaxID=3384793 RepID=UPI0039B6C8DE